MRKSTKKRRGHSRYYLIFALVLLCLTATFIGIYYLLINLSWFNIERIQVRGNQYIQESTVLDLSKSCLGQNLVALDTKPLLDSLKGIARIDKVTIHKRLMHSLLIRITERQGFLYIKSAEGNLYPIDHNGIVLEKTGLFHSEDLPMVQSFLPDKKLKPGSVLSQAPIVKIIATHKCIVADYPEFGQYISEYYVMDDVVHFIDARYGTRVIVSDDNIRKQLERYMFVQDNGGIDRNSVIDLRFKNQVVVKAGN